MIILTRDQHFLNALFFLILEQQQNCATSTREFSITEMQQNSAAYQVYAKNNSTTSNSKKNNIKNSNNSSIGNNENNNNILVQLQDLAKRLGFHDMVKNLDHFTYSPNSNSIKKKAHCSKISEKICAIFGKLQQSLVIISTLFLAWLLL